jgi:outer membrane protein assembly factor BamE (lipoprotein component of BamABCDE complex)
MSDSPKTLVLTILLLSVTLLGGCAQYENKRGVEVSWANAVTNNLQRGSSTRGDVLELLGPPSQVIALEEETALYYLFEHSRGQGLILLLYNRVHVDTRYDRAIFFFDANDVLTEYSTYVYEPVED